MSHESQGLGVALLHTLACVSGVAVLSLALALTLGSGAGRRGGMLTELLRRSIEFSGALPLFVLLPLLSKVWPPLPSSIIVLGGLHGLRLASICRNETAWLYSEAFVRQSRVAHAGPRSIYARHVLPWLMPSLTIGTVMVVPLVVGVEAALSWFGLASGPTFGGYLASGAGTGGPLALGALFGLTLGLYWLAERLINRNFRNNS